MRQYFLIRSIKFAHYNMYSEWTSIMCQLLLVCLSLILLVIDCVESYYYYGLTPSEYGILVGSVIGGLIIIIVIGCCGYGCYLYVCKGSSTSGTTIATESGTAASPPAAVVTAGYTVTSGTPGVILSPPPPGVGWHPGVINDSHSTAIGMDNVDSKSRSNLVDKEFCPE